MSPSPFRKLALTLALFILAAVPRAQVQPEEAGNSQDEVINLDRPVGEDTESFKILRSSNKQEFNEYVTKVYQLHSANPYEILPYIRRTVELEKGVVATAFNVGPDGRERAWIQVSVPSFLLPYVDQAIAAYDVPGFISSPGDTRISYRTRHRSASEVADFLRRSDVSPDGKIVADEATNTIYLTDSPSDFRRVMSTIQFYDVPIPQVDVEVLLVELTKVDQTQLGLDWNAWKRSIGGSIDLGAEYARVNPADGGPVSSSARSFSGLASIGAESLAAFLNYMADEGKAEIHAQTHLVIANGSIGRLSSTTDTPEYLYDPDLPNRSGSDSPQELTAQPATPLKPRFEGIDLAIRPVVTMETTRLEIDMAIRSPVAVGPVGDFVYSDQQIDSNLVVNSGNLYKLGGVDRGVLATESKGIPGLRSIPGLKWFFASEQRVMRHTELFLFVRPVWMAPKLNAAVALSGTDLVQPYVIDGILSENPSVSISPEDEDVLRKLFERREFKGDYDLLPPPRRAGRPASGESPLGPNLPAGKEVTPARR